MRVSSGLRLPGDRHTPSEPGCLSSMRSNALSTPPPARGLSPEIRTGRGGSQPQFRGAVTRPALTADYKPLHPLPFWPPHCKVELIDIAEREIPSARDQKTREEMSVSALLGEKFTL